MSQHPFFQKVQARKSNTTKQPSLGLFTIMNESIPTDSNDEFLNYYGIPPEDHARSDEALMRSGNILELHNNVNNREDEQHAPEEENTSMSQPVPRVRSSHFRPNYGMKTVRKTSASTSSDRGEKRKRKQKWLKEIRKYQRSTKNVIPMAPFYRLAKQVSMELVQKEPNISKHFGENGMRWRKKALAALHLAAEDYLHDLLSTSYRATLHAKRVTIMGRDIKLVQNINTEHRRHSDLTGTKKQASFQERPASTRRRKNPNPQHKEPETENTNTMNQESDE